MISWSFGIREPVGMCIPGEDYFSHSFAVLVLCLWVKPCELYPFYISMSVCIILFQVMFRQPCCWEFMGVAFLIFLRDTISRQTPCSSCPYSPIYTQVLYLRLDRWSRTLFCELGHWAAYQSGTQLHHLHPEKSLLYFLCLWLWLFQGHHIMLVLPWDAHLTYHCII